MLFVSVSSVSRSKSFSGVTSYSSAFIFLILAIFASMANLSFSSSTSISSNFRFRLSLALSVELAVAATAGIRLEPEMTEGEEWPEPEIVDEIFETFEVVVVVRAEVCTFEVVFGIIAIVFRGWLPT